MEPRDKQITQSFWDSNPCGSTDSWAHSKYLRYNYTDAYLLDLINRECFASKEVLEVGCGQGIDASEILKHCKNYVGIDLSEESLKIAKRELGRLRFAKKHFIFVKGDAECLSFPDEAFDVVYSIGVLHHTPDINAAFREAFRVLRRNGYLVLMLYRSLTPLWVVLRTVRGFFRTPLVGRLTKAKALDSFRRKIASENNSLKGTALLELIGCPIINTYSLRDLTHRLQKYFVIDEYSCYRTGFDQLIRILPKSFHKKWPHEKINKLEHKYERLLGFYQVLIARKKTTLI